jgi:Ca-activated chloride channel family protein
VTDPADNSLDGQLADIAVPADLAARIKRSLIPSRPEIDAWICRVPVPETLACELASIPHDDLLEEQLRSVPVPLALSPALRRVTVRQRAVRLVRYLSRLSLAATLFVALSAALAALVAAPIVEVVGLPVRPVAEFPLIYNGPLTVEAEFVADRPPPQDDLPSEIQPSPIWVAGNTGRANDSEAPGDDDLDSPYSDTPFSDSQYVSAYTPVTLTSTPTAGLASRLVTSPDLSPWAQAREVDAWTALLASGLRPMDDVVLLRHGILGSPQYAEDRLPQIDLPVLTVARGIAPPLVRGVDRRFFLKHRVFPPVSPAAGSALETVAVPLVTHGDAVERLARELAAGRRPAGDTVRIEELLASVDYGFPAAPRGKLSLRTAAGPSPFEQPGTGLLQIGVQAGDLARRSQRATHLVLAIDLSHSVGRDGRLPLLAEGVTSILSQMNDLDRLSLVVFGDAIIHEVSLLTRADADTVRQLVNSWTARGGTDLALGLQRGASLALTEAAPGAAQRLVLVTDSRGDMPAQMHDRILELLAAVHAQGVRLDVIELDGNRLADPSFTDWAATAGGEVRRADSVRELSLVLLEALAGQPPLVATDAQLTVKFDPRAVAAYRLIGHEANPLADITPVAVEANLAAGEVATALFEVWFTTADRDEIAQAEVVWHDEAGQSQRLQRRISRVQFAPTFAESPRSLQAAAIVAEIGQELRGSRGALRELGLRPGNSAGMAGVLSLAGECSSALAEQGDFASLVEIARRLAGRVNRPAVSDP